MSTLTQLAQVGKRPFRRPNPRWRIYIYWG
jgi:hypothetical protein